MNLLIAHRFRAALRAVATVALATLLLSRVSARTPVILDTDIGTDIDDTWALALLLRSPELDLKLVVTDTGDTRYRATIVAKMLEAAGRADVVVGIGIDQGPMRNEDRNQLPWVRGYDLSKYPGTVHEDGVSALIDAIMSAKEPVVLVVIGPVPNIARALAREPRIAGKCRLVGMEGSFDLGYGGVAGAVAEANVKGDPAALKTVLAAPWRDILLTPLDTCGLVGLDGANYRAVWCATADPLLRVVIENYCVFAPRVNWMKCDFFATRSTTLFDCVAAYLAYSESLVNIETVRFEVTADGFTRRNHKGPFTARVALSWKDRSAFEAHLAARLVSGK
jgi:inosine-uridine nucleoside N-ribohydrolase